MGLLYLLCVMCLMFVLSCRLLILFSSLYSAIYLLVFFVYVLPTPLHVDLFHFALIYFSYLTWHTTTCVSRFPFFAHLLSFSCSCFCVFLFLLAYITIVRASFFFSLVLAHSFSLFLFLLRLSPCSILFLYSTPFLFPGS